MLWEIAAVSVAIFVIFILGQQNTPPLLGIYAQPGRWFYIKKYLFYVLYSLRQWKLKKGGSVRARSDGHAAGYGQKSRQSAEQMEVPQPLSEDPNALDAVYFEGSDRLGNAFIIRLGRRHERRCELWLSVNLTDIGFFQFPRHPDTTVYNTDGRTFSAGGLNLECLEPHRRWRISFNGLLQKGLNNEWTEKKDLVHVKFSFIWETLSEVFDFDTDIHPGLISDAIAREPWSKEYWERLQSKHQTHYEQCGEMRGAIKVEGQQEELRLHLKSLRDHSYGVRDWTSFHRYVVHFVYLEDGTFFHVSHICLPCTTSNLQTGYLNTPGSDMHPVSWTDLNLPNLGENLNPPDNHTFNFIADGRMFHTKVSTRMTAIYYHGDNWSNIIYEKICEFEVNGIKGHGITEFCYRRQGECPLPSQQSVPMLREPDHVPSAAEAALVLPFTEPAATVARLVGGKGCQLALLTQMQQQQQEDGSGDGGTSASFVVPPGFCLTIAAFSLQLKRNTSLQKKVKELEQIACGEQAGNLKSTCELVVMEFTSIDLIAEIADVVVKQMTQTFGEEFDAKTFAVRSSAAGEDSADLSAAGQMDTILGVRGVASVHKAVTKCWASHFAHPAVEYRRQHGQPVMSSMGVVIQEMVPAQAAGVLFTRDPISGNPGLIVLNSNYGLGESVVSGLSEPDNICVRREWNDKLSIINKDIGSKKKQITTISSGVGGTKTSDVAEAEGVQCSVSDDIILRLARIGVQLEKAFSDPRDIEWAVAGDQIYLLQARPITTLDQESDYDIIHEFDTPLSWDRELLTTANIGEMMPSAMTPLTLFVFARGVENAVQRTQTGIGILQGPHNFYKKMGLCCGQGLLNMMGVHAQNEDTVFFGSPKMAQLAIMGETTDAITAADIQQFYGRRSLLAKTWSFIRNIYILRQSYYDTKKWGEYVKTYSIGQSAQCALELWEAIDADLFKYRDCWSDTVLQSAGSAIWSNALLGVLSKGLPNWTTEMYADVAMLLSKCDDVYSADVPTALQNLGKSIFASEKGAEFVKLSPEEAVRWLESSQSADIGKKFADFMSTHGHRCIREAELREKSWRSEPQKLVKVLQAIVPTVSVSRKAGGVGVEDIDAAISAIKTPVTRGGRFALKQILPKARKAVGQREWGKSISIEVADVFKTAYQRLAHMMVLEGRLPDEDLIYFLIHPEIGTLLRERSAKLIAKAQRRRRLLEKQASTKLARINIGHPVPLDENGTEDDYVITSVRVKGLPVSHGRVHGTARVVTCIEDADAIQCGDILIVHYTDVGWSPYFPIIGGLVTEIGGLVSHGAVVAREYSLPCIVNVPNATRLFKSGDEVILDGSAGTLEKVEQQPTDAETATTSS